MSDRQAPETPSAAGPGAVVAMLCREAAVERARLVAAALRADGSGKAQGAQWLRHATDSLVGLIEATGDVHLTTRARSLLTESVDRAPLIGELAEEMTTAHRPSEVRVAVEDLAAFARTQAERAAAGVPGVVSVDIPPHAPGWVPRAGARVLVDVLGQVVRAAVVHGVPNGGAVRVVFEPGPDSLVVSISDRASRDASPVNADAARTAILDAAAARMVAANGELISGTGPWGGLGTTLRLPFAVRTTRVRWRENG